MNETYDKATDRLRDEMAAKHSDPYVVLIGEYLTDYLRKHPNTADKLADEQKTIAGSIDAMTAEAKKKAKNNRAMMTDAEGYAIVLKYYGIGSDNDTKVIPMQTTPKRAALDLDELLGE